MLLKGKTAIVSGVGPGLGKEIAHAFVREGAAVVIGARRESYLREVADELAALGGTVRYVPTDVTDGDQCRRIVDVTLDELGRVDVLVNNAGVVSHRRIEDLDLAEWHRVIETNLTGIYLVTKDVVEAMPAGGSIINITSAVGLRGMVGRTHYTSSKTGIIGFTRSLAKEVGPRGIRVNAIAPGIIETDQTSGLDDEGRARYEKLTALARLGDPDEIAGATLFFASDLSSYVSGVTINVDGGI